MVSEQNTTNIVGEIIEKMKKDPWHVKLKRNWKFKCWVWKSNIRHYKSWIESKGYRRSYGDCDCFKGLREVDEEYCKNNPKCNLSKIKVTYLEI